MFVGAPLPLSPDVTLSALLSCAGPDSLGAWVRAAGSRRHYPVRGRSGNVLVSSNLGFLLGRCARVAIREGDLIRVLSSESLIHWRALQIVTATPYLPGFARLRRRFPAMQATPDGLMVSLDEVTPEEVLAQCVSAGIRVAGSLISYRRPGTNP
jgi:hypothetical protein